LHLLDSRKLVRLWALQTLSNRYGNLISDYCHRQRFCVFSQATVYVHLIVIQSSNGQTSERGCRKPKGNYTGERVKLLRPETYRRVVRLLAEPREHVSIREICRQCHVTDDTVKAIEKAEAVPIAARKQTLMLQAARIAQLAADRVEEQIGDAPLKQSVVTFGVMTDKLIALSGDSIQNIHHLHSFDLSDDDIIAFAVARSKQLKQLSEKRAKAAVVEVPALPDAYVDGKNAAQKEG
jgi:hypothetical protein